MFPADNYEETNNTRPNNKAHDNNYKTRSNNYAAKTQNYKTNQVAS